MPQSSKTVVISVSLPLSVLIALVSIWGIGMPDFYARETENWRQQSLAQDWFDLVLLPALLLLNTFLYIRNQQQALHIWAATLLYTAYTFTIYAFTIHFSILFVPYCIILGVSVYSWGWWLLQQFRNNLSLRIVPQRSERVIAWFLMLIAIFFLLIWLSDIGNALLQHRVPEVLLLAGKPANPVHVLDIAFLLPLMLLTGALLKKGYGIARNLAAMLLGFLVLMNLTIAWLNFQTGAAWQLTAVMLIFALVGAGLLLWIAKNDKSPFYRL